MASKKKTALDLIYSHTQGIPRERLMAEILTGQWLFAGHRVYNPKMLFHPDTPVEKVEDLGESYVSRGGHKLAQALKVLNLEDKVDSKVLLDLGASTGGFTDCLLRRGASLVYACDVGLNQLAWSLRRDQRVISLEKTNAMDIPQLQLQPQPHWAVADISFRSSVSIAKAILPILREKWMLLMVKPQFEWLDAPSSYKGLVPQDKYLEILKVVGDRLKERNINIENIIPSAIKGKKQGNQEFFYLLSLSERINEDYSVLLERALKQAFGS